MLSKVELMGQGELQGMRAWRRNYMSICIAPRPDSTRNNHKWSGAGFYLASEATANKFPHIHFSGAWNEAAEATDGAVFSLM